MERTESEDHSRIENIVIAEDKIWKVSVRLQADLCMSAANVQEDGGNVIFNTASEELAGKFDVSQVQGYSVVLTPKITFVVTRIGDKKSEAPVVKTKKWVVLLVSKKRHLVEASDLKENEGRLIFADVEGNLVGNFHISDVQGYAVEAEAPQDDPIFEVIRTGKDADEQDAGPQRILLEHRTCSS